MLRHAALWEPRGFPRVLAPAKGYRVPLNQNPNSMAAHQSTQLGKIHEAFKKKYDPQGTGKLTPREIKKIFVGQGIPEGRSSR